MFLFKLLFYSIICYFISSIVHELGHVIVGLINGWKFYMLVIGPFEWKRESLNEKVKFQIEKNVIMWGGMGGTFPTNDKENNLKIWSKVLIAGPLASIIMGITFLPIALITKNLFALLLSFMPLAMGIMCGLPIPIKTGFLYTDGGRWSRLRKTGQEADEEQALFKLMECSVLYGENVPKTINIATIEPLLKSKNAEFQYYGHYYMYQISKYQQDTEQMDLQLKYMKNLKKKVSKIVLDDCKIN